MKRKFIRVAAVILSCLIVFMSAAAFAHSGRTDSSGGHKDNKNKSGLGSYHYHHGLSAHLHSDGVCPYDSPSTPKPTKAPKVSQSTASEKLPLIDAQRKLNDLGYDCGEPDGKLGKGTKAAIKQFQKDNNLKATGKLDDATYNLLMDK